MTKDAAYWITKLELKAHPEGGYYRQTYKADLVLAKRCLPPEFRGARSVSSAIYFLLEEQDFSAFHRLRSDEVWHFYPPRGVKLRPSERRYKPYIVVLWVRLGMLPAGQLPGRFAIRSLTGAEA
jgi:predicted cupin superfamily sugar epimerase